MKKILVIASIFFIVSCQSQIDNNVKNIDDFPTWIVDIASHNKVGLKSIINIAPTYQLVDIDGDNTNECIIMTSESMLVFYENPLKVDSVKIIFSTGAFDEDEKMNWSENISWIKDWKISSHKNIETNITNLNIPDKVMGDGIDLIAPDGKVTMYFNGKSFKWLFYD